MFGGLAFGTLREERHWTDDEVARLRLVADIFANTLARKRSEESLRQALDEVQRLKDQLQREVMYLQGEVEALHGHAGIIGTSPALRRCWPRWTASRRRTPPSSSWARPAPGRSCWRRRSTPAAAAKPG